MTEFKKLVNDARLETAELPWTTIQSLFIKANALNSNAAHFQQARRGRHRASEAGDHHSHRRAGRRVWPEAQECRKAGRG